jgi:hypothetical protein
MAGKPNFIAVLTDYDCINISARAKHIKPATDLATPEQQWGLAYVLDVFPGLYCQSMTPAGSQPAMTINQPVLIVSSGRSPSQHQAPSSESTITMDGEPSDLLHDTRRSHNTTDTECRVRIDNKALHHHTSEYYRTERGDYGPENNSPRRESSQTQPRPPSNRKDINDSKGVRESQRRRDHRQSTSQGGSVTTRLWSRYGWG